MNNSVNLKPSLEKNWNFNSSFPGSTESQISRNDVLDTIAEIFTPLTPIVF